MNQYDLTYATASGTYQRLLQTAGGNIYDGLGNTFSIESNKIRLIFDFNFGELSYNYTIPYDLEINSFETSNPMSVNLLVNGVSYTLGGLISKFDNFSINVSYQGILILNGNKF